MTDPKTRIYVVTRGDENHLIRAAHPSAALNHVARRGHDVRVASQDDLLRLLGSGGVVETAGGEGPTSQLELGENS